MAKVNRDREELTETETLLLEMFFKVDTITVNRKITLGRSGASVFFVFVKEESGSTRLAVAKIQKNDPSGNESNLHKQAILIAEKNGFKKVIPEIIDEVTIDGWSGILYELAGTTIIQGNTLNHALKAENLDYRHISRKISEFIYNWNKPHHLKSLHPVDLMKNMLGTKRFMDTKLMQRFRELDIDTDEYFIFFEGVEQVLPNPAKFFTDRIEWDEKLVDAILVDSHGDFHGENIIISHNNDINVIDFGEMQIESNLFFDAKYLELHLLMDYLSFTENVDKSFWQQLCIALSASIHDTISIPPGFKSKIISEIIPEFRETIRNSTLWDEATLELLEPSLHLAGVAAGLNFMRKTRDFDKAKAALLYACYHLLAALKHPTLQLYQPGVPGCQVSWVSYPLRKQQKISSLSKKLTDNELDLVLVIGPKAMEFLGIPSDYDLVKRIVESPHVGNLTGDFMLFDSVLSDIENVDEFKLHYTQELASSIDLPSLKDNLQKLLIPYWRGILTWSTASELYEHAINFSSSQNYYEFKDLKKDLANSINSCPWIYLRGDASDATSLVLGRNEWSNRRARQKRDGLLGEFVNHLEREPRFILIGFEGEEQLLILEELKGLTAKAECVVLCEKEYSQQRLWTKPHPEFIHLELNDVFSTLNSVPRNANLQKSGEGYILNFHHPTGLKNINLSELEFVRLSHHLEILHEGVIDRDSSLGKQFYFGHTITWSELEHDLDVERDITEKIENQIKDDLKAAHPYRLNLIGEPGAGTTTVGLRLAWNIYFKFKIPVLIVRSFGPELLSHLRTFSSLLDRSFLMIVDEQSMRFDDIDRLFEALQRERIPVVMLRIYHGEARTYSQQASSVRSFFLADKLTSAEKRKFRLKLSSFVSEEKKKELEREQDTILLYMLTAFEREFVGIERFVKGHLKLNNLVHSEKKIVENTAICTYFTKNPLAASFIAHTFNLNHSANDENSKYALVESHMRKYINYLFTERSLSNGQVGYMSRHDLITEEIFKILLGIDWKNIIHKYIEKIINLIPSTGPGSQASILFCYSLVRGETVTTKNALNKDIRVSWLTQFIQENNLSGLENIYIACSKKFEFEPHLIAHLARYYYEFTPEYEKARNVMEQALYLSDECRYDSILNQMMGMTYKRQLESLYKDESRDLERMFQILHSAESWFRVAWEGSQDKAGPKAYGAYVGMALSLLDYTLPRKLLEETDRHCIQLLNKVAEILDDAKFYLDYDTGSHLEKLERRLKIFQQEIDLDNLKVSLGKSINQDSQLAYLHKLNRTIDRLPLEKKNEELHKIVSQVDQLRKAQNDANVTFWWCTMSLKLKNPPLALIEDELLQIARPESLRHQFYLMCVQFMLMLKHPSMDLYERYERSKGRCVQLSQQISWRNKRKEMIGLNMQLINAREINKDDWSNLQQFSGLKVSTESPSETVRPFLGFTEEIRALRNKTAPATVLKRRDSLSGYISFTLNGPRLFNYEKEEL